VFASPSRSSERGGNFPYFLSSTNKCNLCELKYSDHQYALGGQEELRLRNRQAAFLSETGVSHALFPTLITTFGLQPGAYSGYIQSVVTLDDLFQ